MSEEMAVTDNASGDDAKLNGEDKAVESGVKPEPSAAETTVQSEEPLAKEEPTSEPAQDEPSEAKLEKPVNQSDDKEEKEEETVAPLAQEASSEEKVPVDQTDGATDQAMEAELVVEKRGIKRRASTAFSENGDEEFKGFDSSSTDNLTGYSRVLERLEAEVIAASKDFTPLRNIMGTPTGPVRASKRPRQDTDGSRPSSALSSRSDELLVEVGSRGRRPSEMSSPLLRVPLERGWKRELVYRAALDPHSRKNADIYYYTPQGKKLRSTREVSEHLSGTGLTLENFSFFKEPLGVDDPEKEIIRDAKLMRRVESPVSTPPPVTEGKRTPKPKPPKGASPEPATPKSPPAKIKVKSVGSRLSNSGPPSTTTPAKTTKKPAPADNNNTAAWKKPRPPAATVAATVALPAATVATLATVVTPPPPPPLQSRPPVITSPDGQEQCAPLRQVVQPCSLTCGRGVPSLSCAACLCLYHPVCAGHDGSQPFYCKNCRKSTSPTSEPPPLTHKSGVTTSSIPVPTPVPRRVPVPVPVPVPVQKTTRPEKRVLLRMKAASGGAEGERVWAVAPQRVAGGAGAPAGGGASTLPQALVRLNGRRFILVPRALVQPHSSRSCFNVAYYSGKAQRLHTSCFSSEEKRGRGRIANRASSPIANGATSPPATASVRKRGRAKADDTDHFTAFYNRAQENNYNVVVQIFQYLGMRDLAHCARVCKLWKQLASTPALWRHVRMKNSHVSDWGGLCAALKRHGTKWLDLRKMLLPQNDTIFWEQFAQHIPTIDTLERIELCRCPARAVEAVCNGLPGLIGLSALAIRDTALDPGPLARLKSLRELRLKSMAGLALARDLQPLAELTQLTHLSLTSIKELGWCACDVIGQLSQLESLELGECTFRAEFAGVLGRLSRLRRLRLERGTAQCAAPALLRALATLPKLTRLELVNVDVKVGFDDALAECKNIQRLLIIPTYVSQSATTNKQVLSGVLRLKDTLTHLMWGVTIELLRVTELFIDQCDQPPDTKRRDIGECIPVLKPVPGCRLPDQRHVAGPPQVEILPLPTLQRLLSAQLPNTKLKLLRIPFHATWRQSLADFQ